MPAAASPNMLSLSLLSVDMSDAYKDKAPLIVIRKQGLSPLVASFLSFSAKLPVIDRFGGKEFLR